MASSNILSLPFRRSNQISFAATIRKYINTKYDQHPDMFEHDLEVIDRLRKDAVNVREPHTSGIAKLQAYAAQLAWVGGKFPNDIGADFSWYPALGYNTERPMVRNNLKYELMNVLYNLAAVYSQLAVNIPRTSTEGLKAAANYFSLGAGVLKHMKDTILPELQMSDPPEDMDANTLESLTQLLLAQSQECYWQKAVMDGYKDATIAKLAARVSDLYNFAGEAAVKSEAISSAWIHHMTAKHHHFAGAAQYRQACHCLDRAKYGEEVARLMDVIMCVKEGLKEAKGGHLHKMVLEDLQGLKKKAEEDLKRAEKDNDMIFLNIVPSKSDLAILERANMAVAKVPTQVENPYDYLGDRAEFGPPLFSKLVPFSVHVAISIYEERRDRVVNQNIIEELETLNAKIYSILSPLGLPGSLQALEKPLGLPPSLVQHAEELRQADAPQRLQRCFVDIDKLRSSDLVVFEEGKAALATEEEEDQRLRAKHGTARWVRPESRVDAQGAKLWEHAGEIEGYFQSSMSSDGIVREKFEAIEELLWLMVGSDRNLTNFVPSSRSTEPHDDLKPAIGRVRSTYGDVQRLETKRRKRMDAIRDSAKQDDIKPDILKEAARLERTYPNTQIVPAHFDDFFEKRLNERYEPALRGLEQEDEEQDRLLTLVERANQEFEAQKKRLGDKGNREREQALQRLDNTYFKYKEITNNLEVGRKFYNDLNKIVGQGFRDVVKGWVAQRRMEARALEEDLNMPPLSNLNLSRANTAGHQQNIADHATQQTLHQSPPPPAPQANMAASRQQWDQGGQSVWQPQPVVSYPVPVTTTWNPGMGIKFGNGGGGGGSGGQGQQGQQEQQAGQTWTPGSGIKFG